MNKEKDVCKYLTREGLGKTPEYLTIQRKISTFKPEAMVIIDAFPQRDYSQAEILAGLARNGVVCDSFYFSYKHNFNIPDKAETLNTVEILKEAIKKYKKIFVVAPYTLHHFVFIKAVIEETKHPSFNEKGELVQDARWVLGRTKSGDLDSMLRNSIGYAAPYADATGDGAKILSELEAAETGMDYGVSTPYAEERVRNAINLAENYLRCNCNMHTDIVGINAIGSGWFHTGTLMARIKEKWPEVKWVTISNDRGPVSKKTGQAQISVASLSPHEDLQKRIKDISGKKIVVSPLFVHLERSAYSGLKLR